MTAIQLLDKLNIPVVHQSKQILIDFLEFCIKRDNGVRSNGASHVILGQHFFVNDFEKWISSYKNSISFLNTAELVNWLTTQRDSHLTKLGDRRYQDEKQFDEYMLKFIKSELENDHLANSTSKNVELVSGKEYILTSRIVSLKQVTSSEFDLSKLNALCEELNFCYANRKYFSVAMLVRAILDHVPPIFGFISFNEVANNIPGNSFKESMGHLNNSMRKIADRYLHQTIRKNEDMPNENQIDCKRDLDVLLGEIIRRLK